MKKGMERIIVCMVIATMFLTGCGGSGKKECENVLEEFQYACNNVDVNSMLECIDPNVADPIKILIASTGEDPDECLEYLSEAILYDLSADGENVDEMLASIVIEPEEIEVEDNYAVAYCRVSCVINGVDVVRFADIEMKTHDESWYITNLFFVDER